jgi:hypothetical protein
MVTLFQKRYTKFNNRMLNCSINNYFGINDKHLNFTLNKKKDEEVLYLNVSYLKKQEYFSFNKVPNEINDIINSYLNDYIDLQVKINYTSEYPFSQPIWSLDYFASNINSNWSLENIFSFLINCHNSQHARDWSPATDIEKDILDFIRKINIFEYIYT